GSRRNFKIDLPQAVYGNEDTGVYFVFDLQGQPDDGEGSAYSAALNINYFRPSFFGLEAEPEVTGFVRAFDLTVVDPQVGGMGEGEYSADLFLNGWNQGNEFGYSAILNNPDNRKGVVSLPTARLMAAWKWNRNKQD